MILINSYSTLREPPEPNFPHTLLNRRDLSDPELTSHLDGFSGYILSRGDREMTARRFHLLQHVGRVKHQLALDVAERDLPAFETWASAANAVQFIPDGHILDPQGRVLIGAGGDMDPEAQLPYPEDALERKQNTMASLKAAGIKVLPSMPPVLGEEEVEMRSAEEAMGRAHALIIVAVQAEAWMHYRTGMIDRLRRRFPKGFGFLTSEEHDFVEDKAPDEQTILKMGWHYEALNQLLWALGINEALSSPDSIADARKLAATMERLNAPDASRKQLRPANEILDALDMAYRQHWAARQAQLDGNALPDPYGSVVAERHLTLNWLTSFQNAPGVEWDEIETPA